MGSEIQNPYIMIRYPGRAPGYDLVEGPCSGLHSRIQSGVAVPATEKDLAAYEAWLKASGQESKVELDAPVQTSSSDAHSEVQTAETTAGEPVTNEEEAEEETEEEAGEVEASDEGEAKSENTAPPPTKTKGGEVDATPAASKLAKKHGIALSEIEGTGKDGQIIKSDVEAAIRNEK